jgi:hypothetical protein
MDVICRQAGTLSKAILELVMNAVDAKATEVEIALSTKEVAVVDNGTGFESRENIEKFFEVFGQPHEENERKTYGAFRIGRGQAMAFGHNLWRTGIWQMDVDIQERGLDYHLDDFPDQPVPGCQVAVALYEELLPGTLYSTIRDLELWCKYAPIKVILNKKRISVDIESVKWDHVLPEAYVIANKSTSLKVYNLGIHVKDVPEYAYGMAGVVVSRKQLKVNFARNDIQSDCPVWRKIRPKLEEWGTGENKKSKGLNDAGRQHLADQILAGALDLNYDNMGLKVITDVNGRQHSLRDFWSKVDVTSAPLGDRIGDRVHKSGRAFVVADATLERFGMGLKEIVDLLTKKVPSVYRSRKPKVVNFAALAMEFDQKFDLVDSKNLKPNEKIWVSLAGAMWCDMYWRGRDLRAERDKLETSWQRNPQIHVGEGPANGWTDTKSYVAIQRDFLASLSLDLKGLIRVAVLLLHEAAHEAADLLAHSHDLAFYERWEDLISDRLYAMVDKAMSHMATSMECEHRRLTRKQLKEADRVANAARQAKELQEVAANTQPEKR